MSIHRDDIGDKFDDGEAIAKRIDSTPGKTEQQEIRRRRERDAFVQNQSAAAERSGLLTLLVLLALFGNEEPDGVYADMLQDILGFDTQEDFQTWRRDARDQRLSANEAIERLDSSKIKWDKVEKYGSVLQMIASPESGGNYNVVYGGKDTVQYKGQERQITDMTIREVLDWQKQQRACGAVSTAAGCYQFIYGTLSTTVAQAGISLDEKFDQHTQDRLAAIKLEQRGLHAYLNGEITEQKFMANLAKEWASLPKDMGGQSHYAGDGLNKALISPQTVLATLRDAKEEYSWAQNTPNEPNNYVEIAAAKPAAKLTGTYNETVAKGGVETKSVAPETATTKPQGELTQAFAQNAAQKIDDIGVLATLPADKTEAFKVAANEATAPVTTAEPTTLNFVLRLPAQQSAA